MNSKQRFLICQHCGNLVGFIENQGVPLMCCNEQMTELIPNTATASVEKHHPAVTISGDKIGVNVGSTPHPMEEGHHISFVYVETERGGQRKCLRTAEAPSATFSFADDRPTAVFSYCNLHGLWKTEI